MLVAALVIAVPASADSTAKSGRVKYVKRADDICRPLRAEATRKVDHGIRLLEHPRHPSVRRAGRHFVVAWRLMRDLHRPDGYRRKIASWLHREFRATSLGVRSAIWLKRSHFYKAKRLAHRAAVLEHEAARTVRNFDFDHCKPL